MSYHRLPAFTPPKELIGFPTNIVGARDSDASLAEDAERLSGEAVAARAVGIAQPPTKEPTP